MDTPTTAPTAAPASAVEHDHPSVPAGSIVVGVDGSSWSQGALDWATDQAALEHRRLTVVHAVPPTSGQTMASYATDGLDVVRVLEDARAAARTLLDAAVDHARERAPALEVHPVLSVADTRTVLLGLGRHAAMVVVGSRGRGPVASLLLGSTSVAVATHGSCPTLVHRPGGPSPARHRVAVGVDGTALSVPAVEVAFALAAWRGSTLTVVHCASAAGPVATPRDGSPVPVPADEQALVSEALAGMAQKHPDVEVTVQMVRGFAGRHLVAASRDHDLLVIGHHRAGALHDLVYGSVAPGVVEHATCPVVVVPTPRTAPAPAREG